MLSDEKKNLEIEWRELKSVNIAHSLSKIRETY
jgi:hypothetical protein